MLRRREKLVDRPRCSGFYKNELDDLNRRLNELRSGYRDPVEAWLEPLELFGPLGVHLISNWEGLQYRDRLAWRYHGYRDMRWAQIMKRVNAHLNSTYTVAQVKGKAYRHSLTLRDPANKSPFKIASPLRRIVDPEKLKRIRSTNAHQPAVLLRCDIVELAALDAPLNWSNWRIARHLQVSRHTVLKWRARYELGGTKALVVHPSGRGRPARINQRLWNAIAAMRGSATTRAAAAKHGVSIGLVSKIWTTVQLS
jgi:hypothetical protein